MTNDMGDFAEICQLHEKTLIFWNFFDRTDFLVFNFENDNIGLQ